ncbi:DUF502 domain-containing protein [Gemmatimonadota bacterium]
MTLPQSPVVNPGRSPFGLLRKYFLVGLIVIAPVGLTVFVLGWLFQRIDSILGTPLRTALGFRIPGLGLVLLVSLLVFVGWLVHLAAGRQLLRWWNRALSRFPLTGRIYSAVSQITQSIVGSRRRLFQRAVLVPYPTEGLWVVAFVTNEVASEMSHWVGEPCVNVFVPTTPNPTSGFMLIVPKNRLVEIDTPVDEAMKLIVSGGAVSPREGSVFTSRPGLDVESLLKDSREWKRDHLK